MIAFMVCYTYCKRGYFLFSLRFCYFESDTNSNYEFRFIYFHFIEQSYVDFMCVMAFVFAPTVIYKRVFYNHFYQYCVY